MPEVKKKRIYRLFKVAKELNVGSDTLVEYLQDKGHKVSNVPNTKLSGDQYELLLKEFASEKILKEKAEQFIERRKEEGRVVRSKESKPVEEEEESPISAQQLRNKILPKRKRGGQSTEESTSDKPKEPVTPRVETPIVAKTETPPAEEVSSDMPQLKVVGKIDLDSLSGKKKNKKPVAKEPEPEVEVEEVPKSETPPATVTEAPSPKEEAPAPEEIPEPVQAKAVEVSPPVEREQPAVEAKEPKVTEVTTAETEVQEETEAGVIRAGDNMPKLSGLKVMGKIELGSNKKQDKEKASKSSKAKVEEKAKATEGKKSGEDAGDEGDKKKRRRKRKRKRKASDTSAKDDNKGSQDKGRRGTSKKKEKPSEKEVEESIRQTLSQMSQGPSRTRQKLRRAKRDADAARREQLEQEQEEQAGILEVTEFITANEFANLMEVPVNDIIKKSFALGMMISINQRLDAELITIIAEEYGYDVNFIDVAEQEIELVEEEDDPADLKPRTPIITVMGHVDHGKTTLLDHLRKTNVTSQEAGGITQHIGAYEVKLQSGNAVTFLDTPGHEAFTAMRARGAKVTDVVIIVIAADDSVMPQTREAINHAQAAEVPMVFAINKIDKPNANPDQIKSQLAEMNILVEDWGGTYQSQEISALKGEGVDDLLEKVILEAELLELKANPDRSAAGTVIEARLDRGLGNVATMLVQNGTLEVGDEMVIGVHYAKVRALINQKGKRVKKAGPSKPVQVLGLSGQPQAGDTFHVFSEDGKAKSISQRRGELYREQQLRQTRRITLDEIGRRRAIGNFEELNIIIRADVDGSVEALSGSLLKLSTEEVQVNILLKAVGAITEGDVLLASASDAIIIAFNVRPSAKAKALAEKEEIDIRTYSVIYDAINDVTDALEGLLSPEIREEIMGTAEVREVFKITKVGAVAGCMALQGKIYRDEPVRIIRDGVVIYDSKLSSLKRYKDDVKEVNSGMEFGAQVTNYNDIRQGDILESYKKNEIKRKLKPQR